MNNEFYTVFAIISFVLMGLSGAGLSALRSAEDEPTSRQKTYLFLLDGLVTFWAFMLFNCIQPLLGFTSGSWKGGLISLGITFAIAVSLGIIIKAFKSRNVQ
jgi:hypothetical protein